MAKTTAPSASTDAPAARAQRGVQSVEVGGRLLQALAHARGPLALSDLAAAADLAPGQAHAYLVSLSRLGLVKRDDLSGRYEPGPLSLRLGLLHLEQQPAFRAAVPRVAELAAALGFSIAICIAGPRGPTIVRYEHAGFPLHVNLHVGTVMSLPGTSTGRVFCAYAAHAALQTMWAAQHTDTDAEMDASVEPAVAAIRDDGMACSVDVPSPGISSLSVPVLDTHGTLCLALTAIGSTGVIDVTTHGAVARALIECASAIGRDIANGAHVSRIQPSR